MKIGSFRPTLAAATLMALLAAGGRSADANGVPPLAVGRAIAALDARLLARAGLYFSRNCVKIGYEPFSKAIKRTTFEDTRFAYNPAAFRMVLEPNAAILGHVVQARLRLLAKAGLLAEKPLPGGATAFSMTWKGFAASGKTGCFKTLEARPGAELLSWKGRSENGVVLYDVVARVSPGKPAAWAKSKAFADAFGASAVEALKDKTRVFGLALGRHGYVVLSEDGRRVRRDRYDQDLAEIYIRRAGPVNAASIARRIQGELNTRLQRESILCLPLPWPDEADEAGFIRIVHGRAGPVRTAEAHFTYYDLPGVSLPKREKRLRGYAKLRKLEALGLAQSERIAAKAVRFTVGDPRLQGPLKQPPTGCFMVGRLVVDKVLDFEPLEPWRLESRVSARLKVLPFGPLGARAIALYGNFRRMAEVGVGVRVTMQAAAEGLRFFGEIPRLRYEPDLSKVSLPAGDDKIQLRQRAGR